MSLNRTAIEWVRNPDGTPGFTWNPIVGCSHGCPYCWARKQAKRAKNRCEKCYQFVPHLHRERLDDPLKRKEPSTIFVCSMGDLFCDEVYDDWVDTIEHRIEDSPQHKFIVLTKNPGRAYYHNLPDMDNVLFGVSIDTVNRFAWWLTEIESGCWPNIKIISFEPLLEQMELGLLDNLKWIIIGGQTGEKFYPPRKWVMPIVEQAKKLNIPVFMKPNLGPGYAGQLIQEFPKELVNAPPT